MKGAVKRQPPGSTGTAALGALFFPSVAQTNTPTDALRWEEVGGAHGRSPRMVQNLQNKR